MVIPLWIRNRTPKAQEITLSATLLAGWMVDSGAGKFTVGARQMAAARIEVNLPPLAQDAAKKPEVQEVIVRAEANGQALGDVKLRVELRKRALPQ